LGTGKVREGEKKREKEREGGKKGRLFPLFCLSPMTQDLLGRKGGKKGKEEKAAVDREGEKDHRRPMLSSCLFR